MYEFIRDYQEGLLILAGTAIFVWLCWFAIELWANQVDEKDEHETNPGT
jgi:hypothetical protein